MPAQNFDPTSTDAMFAQILTKIEGLERKIEEGNSSCSKKCDPLEARIRSLENQQARVAGACIVLSVLATQLANHFLK